MRNNFFRLSFALIVISPLAFLDSCVSNDVSDDCNEIVSYASHVSPIIQTKCAISGCHNGSSALPDWTNFSQLQARAGDVREVVIQKRMPPSNSPAGPLTEDQITAISCWVNQGAQNN
jgi:uncharacterized membrane protein